MSNLIKKYKIFTGESSSGGSGGGSNVTDITYAALNTLKSSNSLIPGFYNITDKADLGIIVQAVSNNQLAYEASGIFLNADWQDVGVYTGTIAVTGLAKGTNRFLWIAAETGYINGDIVIWDCLHYQVKDQSMLNGDYPYNNTNAYTALPKTSANVGYITETRFMLYNFSTDIIDWVYDKLGNVVPLTSLNTFQFGRDIVYNNNIKMGTVVWMLNNNGPVFNNSFEVSNIFIDISGGENLGTIQNTKFLGSSGVDITVFFSDISFGLNSCVIETPQNITSFEDKLHQNKTLTLNSSNFDCTLTSGVSAGTFTIPTNRRDYVGKFIMNQTNTTISKIANTSTYFRTILEIANGKTHGFTRTAIGSAVTNDLVDNATGTISLVGRTNGADFIEIERSGTFNRVVNYKLLV